MLDIFYQKDADYNYTMLSFFWTQLWNRNLSQHNKTLHQKTIIHPE